MDDPRPAKGDTVRTSFLDGLDQGHFQAGAFVKTPAAEVVELLALGGLDFVCLDAEHAPFGRREIDGCIALARAVGLPALVRVEAASPTALLQALDSGATGVLVPHVKDVQTAQAVARLTRFGDGGRGYAGSTRSAGFATRSMGAVLSDAASKPVVFAQIEDPGALEAVDGILAVEGITGVFFGAADLAVGLGVNDTGDPAVRDAFADVAAASRRAGKPLAAFAGGASHAARLKQAGVGLALLGSDQSYLLAGAQAVVEAAHRAGRTATA